MVVPLPYHHHSWCLTSDLCQYKPCAAQAASTTVDVTLKYECFKHSQPTPVLWDHRGGLKVPESTLTLTEQARVEKGWF